MTQLNEWIDFLQIIIGVGVAVSVTVCIVAMIVVDEQEGVKYKKRAITIFVFYVLSTAIVEITKILQTYFGTGGNLF